MYGFERGVGADQQPFGDAGVSAFHTDPRRFGSIVRQEKFYLPGVESRIFPPVVDGEMNAVRFLRVGCGEAQAADLQR